MKASSPNTPSQSPTRAFLGQRQQDLGGSITYARKYCLQGLYGLFADDGLDPDEISYGDAGTSQSKPSRSSTPKDSPEPPTPAPMPVTVEKPESDPAKRDLTDVEKERCFSIIKNKKEWRQVQSRIHEAVLQIAIHSADQKASQPT